MFRSRDDGGLAPFIFRTKCSTCRASRATALVLNAPGESRGMPQVTPSPGLWLVEAAPMPLPLETSIMTKLTDTQAILLLTAAQRENGSLLPLPATLKPGGGASKAMNALVTRGFVEERDIADGTDAAAVHRTDEDRRVGLFLTAAGAAAIGVVDDAAKQSAGGEDAVSPALTAGPNAKAPVKSAIVLGLMRRPAGATLPELIEITGWLPHTTRAALTGLRKKGHEITRGKRDGVTFYVAASK